MSTDYLERKDPIVVDENLIGREIFFTKFPGYEKLSYLTPNKRYTVIGINGNLITFECTDVAGWSRKTRETISSLNTASGHLYGKALWKLAARTSSKQSVVKTTSGKKL